MLPAETPRLSDVTLDWRVLLFAGALAIITGIISGTAHTSRIAATAYRALKAGSRGTTHSSSQLVRRALVIGELGLAVLLVSGAGLLIHSLWALSTSIPAFAPKTCSWRASRPTIFCHDTAAASLSIAIWLRRFAPFLPLQRRPDQHASARRQSAKARGQNRKLCPRHCHAGTPLWMNAVSPAISQPCVSASARPRIHGVRDFRNSRVVILSAETARRYFRIRCRWKHLRLVGQRIGARSSASRLTSAATRCVKHPEWMDALCTCRMGRLPL